MRARGADSCPQYRWLWVCAHSLNKRHQSQNLSESLQNTNSLRWTFVWKSVCSCNLSCLKSEKLVASAFFRYLCVIITNQSPRITNAGKNPKKWPGVSVCSSIIFIDWEFPMYNDGIKNPFGKLKMKTNSTRINRIFYIEMAAFIISCPIPISTQLVLEAKYMQNKWCHRI